MTPSCISLYIMTHTSTGPRYLLLRRCSGGYLDQTWQMVTGGIDEGETAIQAAIREMQEETGLKPIKFYSADAVETFFIPSLNKMMLVPVFVAFVNETKVLLSPTEHDTYEWLCYEEAEKKLIWSEQRRIIKHIHEQFGLTPPKDLLLIKESTCLA